MIAVVLIAAAILLACLVALLYEPLNEAVNQPGRGPKHRGLSCSVTEEWSGVFIGRRECLTHEVHWDGGGDCPNRGTLVVGRWATSSTNEGSS